MLGEDTPDCAFCAIARGDVDGVQVVAAEDDWLAFFPLSPATTGHTLVIPRIHVCDYWDAEPNVASSLASACVRLGRAISEVVQPEGMNLITSAGAAAEQTVFHLHIHLVPRWQSDAIDRIWPAKEAGPRRADDALAGSIRDAWARLSGGSGGVQQLRPHRR